MISAMVSEIYASIQGEGPFTGERQVFVRLAGCPLRCRYCDTPGSLTAKGHSRRSVEEVLNEVGRLSRKSASQTVSVTGGEPLSQPTFVRDLFKKLKAAQFRTYLETAGIHAKALRSVIGFTDVVAMDIKLPSATGKQLWNEHAEFLKVGKKKIFVKIVIEKRSTLSEIKAAVNLLGKIPTPPLLVLQPVTTISSRTSSPSKEQLADAYQIAASLSRVLIMPQQHKTWKAR
ncbi:MAG: 7-carboxy-7-deazaguanine synthase [Elusimicrobia bacterium]|nr:7-carboxy-7-deazaguanine synthase [Elusimicrobiota bacterium]